MVQTYLPEVRQGDKRIILVDGDAVGAINRVPQEGEARSNLHVGGTAQTIEISARDRQICERLGPELRRRGLVFVGIDVIGDYLTEINVTSFLPASVKLKGLPGPTVQQLFGMLLNNSCRTIRQMASCRLRSHR